LFAFWGLRREIEEVTDESSPHSGKLEKHEAEETKKRQNPVN